MTRYIRAAMLAALATGGGVGCQHSGGNSCGGDGGAGGCQAGGATGGRIHNCYDVAWPERYNFAARQAVLAPFAQQAANGHFAEQTVWNWYFEPGSDKLNSAGMEKLDTLARSTPAPDPKLFLQAARDVGVTADNMDKVGAMRDDLTAKRAAAVMRYMATQPGTPVAYSIDVYDAPTPGIYSVFSGNAWRGQRTGYVGGISGGAGSSAVLGGTGGGIGVVSGAGAGSAPVTGPGSGAGSGAGSFGPGY